MSLTVRNIKAVAPLLDRVLVHRIKAAEKTASGIFLPSSIADKLPSEATVLAVGPGYRLKSGDLQEVSVKVGDKVLLPQFGGTSVKVEDEEYHLFRDSEILAKLSA